MKVTVRNILVTLFTLFTLFTSAQDSSRLRVSLLTCTPGDQLYSIFGHSALRIIDSNMVIGDRMADYVYNYGTFNFEDEGFYLKFIRGKLMYYISVEQFENFQYDYKAANRGITEQVLDLTTEEETAIRQALNENLKEENKFYKYDFFLDNCTTRLRDLIVKSKTPAPLLPAVMPTHLRFRDAIDVYLIKGKQYWSKLGIDILLGARTDAVMTVSQQQFLPDNLMTALDSTKNVRIINEKLNLYNIDNSEVKGSWFTPGVFFSLLFFIYLIAGLINNRNVLTVMDGLLFFLTGALGILLILMMTATDHSMTKENYNILWAWPTHIIIAFLINNSRTWVKYYFMITAVALVILLAAWAFLPQQMNNALLPFVFLLIYRSVMRFYKDPDGKVNTISRK